MAAQKRNLFSPLARRSPTSSPPLSAVRSSPLSSATLISRSTTSSAFTSSPPFSFTQTAQSCDEDEPDYFEEFTYSSDMEEDFRRIDSDVAAILAAQTSTDDGVVPSTTLPRDKKTWVVFHGRTPGLYNCGMVAAIQSQGFSDGFQRAYPNHDAAEAAWQAFMRNGTFPDYGRSPWVVYFGRRPGVFTRVTDVEGSVRGFSGAIYRSCASVGEGRIRLQLFTEKIGQFFSVSDPFAFVEAYILQPDSDVDDEELEEEPAPAAGSTTPVLAMPNLPLVSNTEDPNTTSNDAAESLASASNDVAESSKLAPDPQVAPSDPHPGEGWYVAHHAALPGVYFGVEALKRADPRPGGFQCAVDKESADLVFHGLTLEGKVVWVRGE